MTLHVVGGGFDERRNTSRVFAVEPGALDRALRSCAYLRRSDPALVRWLEAGAPPITSDAQHFEVFGEPYERKRGKKR